MSVYLNSTVAVKRKSSPKGKDVHGRIRKANNAGLIPEESAVSPSQGGTQRVTSPPRHPSLPPSRPQETPRQLPAEAAVGVRASQAVRALAIFVVFIPLAGTLLGRWSILILTDKAKVLCIPRFREAERKPLRR